MSTISIQREHSLGDAEAKNRVANLEAKLQKNYGVSLDWKDANDAFVKGKGVTGDIHVDDSSISLNLKLGMMLKPLAGKIKSAIEEQLDRELA